MRSKKTSIKSSRNSVTEYALVTVLTALIIFAGMAFLRYGAG